MRDEKEGLEQQLQMVLMNTNVLEAWVNENEGKLSGGGLEGVSGDVVCGGRGVVVWRLGLCSWLVN